jgi:glycosyltransferase involved in cell wall biosynthesis
MTKVLLSGNSIDVKFLSSLLKDYPDIQVLVVNRSILSIFGNFVKVIRSDVFHHISAKLSGIEGFLWLVIFTILKKMGKKIVLHWIGTDVLEADQRLLNRINPLIDLHLANSPWLVDELKTKGVESKCLILPSDISTTDISPLPKKFTVLVYLGWKKVGATDFYGGKIIKELIKNTSYNYIILGGARFKKLPNVEYIDIVNHNEMENIYKRSTVLLRITKHDALSHMVQESLSMGRYVIWSQKFPFCEYATDYNTSLELLKNLEDRTEPNVDGAMYFRENLSKNILVKKIIETYRDVSY